MLFFLPPAIMNPSSTLRKISKGGRYCNTGITVPKASMKKLFNKGMESLSKSDSNTYGFVINDKGAYGKLGTEDKSRILTAYVRLKNGDSVKVWSIRNNRPESIPASLCLWFKNKKKLGLCIQTDDEESYYLFGYDEFPLPSDCSICCVVENEDYALCLYVDNTSDHITWIQEYKLGSNASMIQFLKHIPTIHEKEDVIKDEHTEIRPEFF